MRVMPIRTVRNQLIRFQGAPPPPPEHFPVICAVDFLAPDISGRSAHDEIKAAKKRHVLYPTWGRNGFPQPLAWTYTRWARPKIRRGLYDWPISTHDAIGRYHVNEGETYGVVRLFPCLMIPYGFFLAFRESAYDVSEYVRGLAKGTLRKRYKQRGEAISMARYLAKIETEPQTIQRDEGYLHLFLHHILESMALYPGHDQWENVKLTKIP